jgi:hypothetical protein
VWRVIACKIFTLLGGGGLAPHILQRFPLGECGLHNKKIRMLAVFRVLLDGSACPCEAAPARWTNCILRKNLCQGVRELIAKCRNVIAGAHDLPATWVRNVVHIAATRCGM